MLYNKIFLEAGLNEVDAKIYETLLALREATPAALAKDANVPRENTYYILKKLASMGLIKQVPDAQPIRYQLTKPDALREILLKREEDLHKSRQLLDKLYRQVVARMGSENKSSVARYYQGVEAVKKAYINFLGEAGGSTLYGLMDSQWFPEMKGFFVKERLQRNIPLKLIVADNQSGRKMINDDAKENRQTRLMDESAFPERTYITMYKDRVLLVNESDEGDGDAIIINQALFAQALEAMFWMIWQSID